jgi:3,4-dehydroadipyl-CoA semialdehyde dehydrogenase
MQLLPNFLGGEWITGSGAGTTLFDPVQGTALARVDATGLDLVRGLAFARDHVGPALRAMSYAARGELLARIVKVLQSRRDAYYEIACANSGTVKNDSAVDIDGAIYTVSTFAKLAGSLGDRPFLADGESVALAKDGSFRSRHVQVPARGVALFINAFNFPAWGLWEKAAPALLSGVPVVVKPATATAWLTQRMVKDVVDAGILPPGALSVVCGSSAGLLDALLPQDVLSFTGSAETAALVRSHAAVTRHSVRVNIEADSLNSALLLPDAAAGDAAFELLVREVVGEMTVKSGQKCTAIRRVFVPRGLYEAVADAVDSRLGKVTVGNPRSDAVRMGALVSRAQFDAVHHGLAQLKHEARVIHDGNAHDLVDADPAVACCVGPTLLGVEDGQAARLVHDLEVFGPVATLLPYARLEDAFAMVRRGHGSLVCSLYGSDTKALSLSALELADTHGRVHIVSPDVATTHTGHGNVMPQSLHGGPGRAGGGEELGGLRALGFYHRRAALQAGAAVLATLDELPAR